MRNAGSRVVLFVAAGVILASVSVAQVGSRVPDWPVPSAADLGKATDAAPPRAFIGVVPCRVVDTRGPVGPYGGPSLPPSTARTFDLNNGPCSGLPAGIEGYSLNVTVTGTQGPGFILINPTGGPVALVSTLNYVAGQTIANAVIVPAGTAGAIDVTAGVSGTDLIIDVNGYFSATADNQANTFEVVNSGASNIPAIQGITNSTAANATGVRGLATAVTGTTVGVWGQTNSTSDNATGVYGVATASGGTTVGVWGRSQSGGVLAMGVYGEDTSGGNGNGVVGSGYYGVTGNSTHVNGTGVVGRNSSDTARGSLGLGGGVYGVFAGAGTIGCNGCVKQFVEPHPTDPSKTIHYGSLEGPEAGTYFRGSARTIRGQAVIEVPDHFRWVTQEEGMTVQLTPLGELAMMAVVSKDLNRIVVRSSKDVSFDFLVQGIRPAFRDFQPVQDGDEYRPGSPADRVSKGWTAWTRQRLVENGTYNPDGTVNMETAERLGWTKAWLEPAPTKK